VGRWSGKDAGVEVLTEEEVAVAEAEEEEVAVAEGEEGGVEEEEVAEEEEEVAEEVLQAHRFPRNLGRYRKEPHRSLHGTRQALRHALLIMASGMLRTIKEPA